MSEKINPSVALKFDSGTEKLPWDLFPWYAGEQISRVLLFGKRKYTACADCGARVYPDPKLNGDSPRDDCPKCKSKNIQSGDWNWAKGFKWTRLIASSFRHLIAFTKGENFDPESGELHLAHLGCCVVFLLDHVYFKLGVDDRHKYPETKE